MPPQHFSTWLPQSVSIIPLDIKDRCVGWEEQIFPSPCVPLKTQGMLYGRTSLHMCYAQAELQSCGDWCLCIHFAGCHSNTVHFQQSFLRIGFALKHFRSSKYHYEINLLSKWCDIFFCVICSLLKPFVKEQKEKNIDEHFRPTGGDTI